MQEKINKKDQQESIIDVKGTLEAFVEEEKPELSQEEAIKAYKKDDTIQYPEKKKKKSSEEDENENEDDEHLKRVKKELLESLERVDKMSHKIFDEKDKNISNVKLKNEAQKTKNREQTMEQMKEKVEEEKSRE